MSPLSLIFLFIILALLAERVVARRRQRERIAAFHEEIRSANHEKKRVVEFLIALIGASREEIPVSRLYEKILSAASSGAQAASAAIFIADETGKLSPALVSGLFPRLTADTAEAGATRARRIENAFRADDEITENTPIGIVAKTGNPLLIAHGENSPLIAKNADPALAARSLIAVPIIYGERFLGVLAIANPSQKFHRFTEAHLEIVKSVGEQAGMALYLREFFLLREEKNILDFDLSLAGNVQQLLLPNQLPTFEKIDVAAHYRPMRKVGGDLYSVIKFSEGRAGVIVADVSGKGIQASLLMAMCHVHLRHLVDLCEGPADLLRRLNAAMQQELGGGRYVTAACALIDTESDMITLARAGHELPLLLAKRDGFENAEFIPLRSEGMAVGMAPPEIFDASLTQITLPFEPGNTLVFFTDGLTEARTPDGTEFGAGRLKEIVRANAAAGADEINHAVLDAMEKFRDGTPLCDDLTLVTLRYR